MSEISRRPHNFDEFCAKHISEELKYIISREELLSEGKKAKEVLSEISSSELPQCESLNPDQSKIGDFISRSSFEDIYDEEIYDNIEKGVLCYIFNDEQTWWQIKKDNEGEGLVRIK